MKSLSALFKHRHWAMGSAVTVLALAAAAVWAQANSVESVLRKNLAERYPQLPKIDEVTKTPIAGVYELRMGTDIIYSDEKGDYLLQGDLIDTKQRANLTEARINKLTAIDFASLPLKDAITYKQGDGSRKLVVFADPNCGYCKRFERDLLNVKNVTIYTFVYPILGADSNEKSRNIWCSADKAKAWRDWMVSGTTPAKAASSCDDAALQRNVVLGRKHRVSGTPAVVFEDGSRAPGAISAEQVEKRLQEVRKG